MKVMPAEEAVKLVRDRDVIVVCGCENLLLPERILTALEERFLETGHPRDLTEIHPIIHGMGVGLGLEHLAHEGMLKRVIGSGYSYLETSQISKKAMAGELEAYVVPMGTVFGLLCDIASGRKFHLTTVGLNTFVDPRIEGGKVNEATREDIVTLETIDGTTYLKYPTFPINVAIIRGTTADPEGNITMEDEPVRLGVAAMAMAAKNSGGKVIVQVRRLAESGSLDPQKVIVPGILVDAVVVDPEQSVTGGSLLNPALTGEIRLPLGEIEPLALNERKAIVRRALMEVDGGEIRVINLGVGIPVDIPRIAVEKGTIEQFTFFPEHGSIGGVPGERAIFGTNINPDAIIDSTQVFDYFQGGGLDATFLGFGQIDQSGNVNVSKFGTIMPGCGGFVDITHKTKNIVFCGTLTAGGLETDIVDGKLMIKREGRFKKFLPQVEQITFNAENAKAKKQKVTYVTERAVFIFTEQGLQLTEIAPGIDLEEEVMKNIDFPVKVSSDLKLMPAELFR